MQYLRVLSQSCKALLYAALLVSITAQAQPKAHSLAPIPAPMLSPVAAPQVKANAWMLLDYETGWILTENNARERIEPASLTKLMTSFIVFQALKQGHVALEDQVYVSEKAWKTGGSKMFLNIGDSVTVLQLLNGLIVQSGNDAAVALAQHVAGDERSFADLMNQAARALGMADTNFTNASGLPDDDHYSTAADLMVLARAIIRHFPDFFPLYSQHEYTYADITQKNRNLLLYRDPDADGLKTGYTENAGYVLIGTIKRDGHRLMGIVTGTESKTARADEVQKLLNYGFRAYQFKQFFTPEQQVTSIPLLFGQHNEVKVATEKPLGIIFPRGKGQSLSASLSLPEYAQAPLLDREAIGEITVKFEDKEIMRQNLEVLGEQKAGPWYKRIWHWIKRLFM